MTQHQTKGNVESESDAVDLNNSAINQGKIRASHLLVKHRNSRRPSSWREVFFNTINFIKRS